MAKFAKTVKPGILDSVPIGIELIVVASASCLLTSIAWRRRVRRRPTPVLRAALADQAAEYRHAAILLAARDGIHRYLDVLSAMIQDEPSDDVRTALAEALVDGEWKHADAERHSVELRAWGARVLSEPQRGRRSGSQRSTSRRPSSCPAVGRIDALQLMEALDQNQRARQRGSGRSLDVRPARRKAWIAGAHEIDALEVVYTLTAPRPRPRAAVVSIVDARPGPAVLALPAAPPDVSLDDIVESLIRESSHQLALGPGTPPVTPTIATRV